MSSEQKESYGIEETMDVILYGKAIVEKLKEHKGDDGKIDGGEIASTLVTTAGAGIAAIVGSGKITLEAKDYSPEEKDRLLEEALPILQGLASLFYPG